MASRLGFRAPGVRGSSLQRRRAGRHERGAHPRHTVSRDSHKSLPPHGHRSLLPTAYLLPPGEACRPTHQAPATPTPHPGASRSCPCCGPSRRLGDPTRSPPGTRRSPTRSPPTSRTICSDSGSIRCTAARCCSARRRWLRTTSSVPLPTPQLERSQVGAAGGHRAGRRLRLGGVRCRFGPAGATSGSLLAADLRPEQYGEEERLLLERRGAAARADARADGAAVECLAPITRLRRRASRRWWTRWRYAGAHAGSPQLYLAELGPRAGAGAAARSPRAAAGGRGRDARLSPGRARRRARSGPTHRS